MRKLHMRSSRLGLLTLAISIGSAVSAQTTFQSSNNPEACVRVEKISKAQTTLSITQLRNSVSYVPLSQSTVLRDPRTGLSYSLESLDVEITQGGAMEIATLRFSPFLDGVVDFELVNPASPNASLYIKGIRKQLTNPGSLAELDGSVGI